MSISIFVKTITLYGIVIVSFLSIFQTSSTIIHVLASSIDDPDRISKDGFDISYRMNDQRVGDLKNHFETGLEDRNKDNWVFVNHDIYGSRNSSQTQIDKANVGDLKVQWRLNNTF